MVVGLAGGFCCLVSVLPAAFSLFARASRFSACLALAWLGWRLCLVWSGRCLAAGLAWLALVAFRDIFLGRLFCFPCFASAVLFQFDAVYFSVMSVQCFVLFVFGFLWFLFFVSGVFGEFSFRTVFG